MSENMKDYDRKQYNDCKIYKFIANGELIYKYTDI